MEMDRPLPDSRKYALFACALLVVVVSVLFGRVAGFEFLLWDDDRMLLQNPPLQALTWQNINWMLRDRTYNSMYMPLGWLEYAVTLAIFGKSAAAHHLINLGLHV